MGNVGVIYFMDPSRQPVRASIESYQVFLKKDGSLNVTVSQIVINLYPDLAKRANPADQQQVLVRGARKLFPGARRLTQLDTVNVQDLQDSLLELEDGDAKSKDGGEDTKKGKKGKKANKVYEPNILKANVIVSCDV